MGATEIAKGKLKSGKTNVDITKDNITEQEIADGTQVDGDLSNRTINTDDTQTKYYYLVVKYPNNGDQSEDEEKQISVTLSIDGTAQLSVYQK